MGTGGHIVPAADFFICCRSIRGLKKALDKVLKPMVKRVKVEIVNYTIFISTSKFELQIQFRPTTKLCIRRFIGAISFTLANSNIWSVKKLWAIINLSSQKFVETQLFTKCKTDFFLKKKFYKILLIKLYIFMSALSYQFCYLSYPFLEANYQNFPGKKIPVTQTIIIRHIIINQIASNSVFYSFLPC